jgi:hypothetical protein
MVIAIPLAAQTDYTELKYCLRSIEKHLPEIEVVIIGSIIPKWVHNVTHIRVPDIAGRKQLTIRKKLWAALQYSNEILATNDDIFFVCDSDPKSYPYYYGKDLIGEPEAGAKPLLRQLSKLRKPVKHFDIHYPIIYERSKFLELSIFPSECIIKSMYANYHEIEGVKSSDCKVNKKINPEMVESMVKHLPCISTGPYGLHTVLPILEKLFPDKSKYEL